MAKKNFKDNNPANAFLSEGTKTSKQSFDDLTEAEKERLLEEHLKNREKKTERVNLLIQPSIHKKLKDYAKANDTSMNEAINIAIKDLLNK